jgi:BirA family biotin operon repressor/biotin-[acetyl-CoA-carboxylase] ligase
MIAAAAPLFIFDELDSTNEEARRRALRGDTGPAFLLARRQTAGRGRRGRTWTTIEGNLFLTYLGATQRPPAEIALLGFATGLALAEFCETLTAPARVRLKWPNDLFLDGGKAAGVLLESGGLDDGRSWFAVGVGFNLIAAPADAGQPTAALRDVLPPDTPAPAPETVARDLIVRLGAWAGRFDREGFSGLLAAWTARAQGLGAPARVAIGAQTVEGVVRGLTAQGELALELANGEMRLIAAGDIVFPHLATA